MKCVISIIGLLFSISGFCSEIDITLKMIETAARCKMKITSGYRNKAYNKRVGGVKNSYHLYNRARDIVPRRKNCISFKELGKIACKYTSTIVYYNHIHIDNRAKRLCIKGRYR